MKKHFSSNELPLAQLLDQAADGKLQLPDFQRGWVWDDDHIRSLLASVSLSYPIGAVMTLVSENTDVNFKARKLEGVSSNVEIKPHSLLLDGQQRLTSLFQALMAEGPVATRDSRGRGLKRHYYASINECINQDSDREEYGILSVPSDRIVRRDFGRRVELDLSTRESEIAAEMFPLEIVLNGSDTMDWQIEYLQKGPGNQLERLEKWKLFQDSLVNPIVQYHLPTIELDASTPKEAVCQVFEKVNTGGVTLTVFELVTATYAADNFELRKDWDWRRSRIAQHDLLSTVDGTAFLQIITLLATYQRRRSQMEILPNDERTSAVSCKRRDVLRLSLWDYQRWADIAERGLLRTVPFLHSHKIFQAKDLPYATQLLPLAAIYAWLTMGNNDDSYTVQQKLGQWFWCGVLGEMYGGATETRFANDVEDCIAWIESDDASLPRTVQVAQFQAERLLTLRTRNSAAYKGLYALQMKQGSRDFKTGQSIDVHAYMEDAIDIHHIFPRNWCDQNDIESGIANTIVNKTALDARTNRRIGGNPPSVYLSRIESNDGIESQVLDGFLRSHDIDPLALRQDEFAKFFNKRFERQLVQVERAMGKPVNRNPDRNESPFSEVGVGADEDVLSLIESGESVILEFKSTAIRNLKTKEKDLAVTWAIVRTIAAFMNTDGGTLLVGVDDAGKPIGIEQDYSFVRGSNRDGWGLWLADRVTSSLGSVAATDFTTAYCTLNDLTVARIEVRPGDVPVFATKSGSHQQYFFARINNSTRELVGQEVLSYQRKRFST